MIVSAANQKKWLNGSGSAPDETEPPHMFQIDSTLVPLKDTEINYPTK